MFGRAYGPFPLLAAQCRPQIHTHDVHDMRAALAALSRIGGSSEALGLLLQILDTPRELVPPLRLDRSQASYASHHLPVPELCEFYI